MDDGLSSETFGYLTVCAMFALVSIAWVAFQVAMYKRKDEEDK